MTSSTTATTSGWRTGARQHRPRAQHVEAGQGCRPRPPRSGAEDRRGNRLGQDQGHHPLPGLHQLHDVGRGRPGPPGHSIISNAVSLHPMVPTFSRFKIPQAAAPCSRARSNTSIRSGGSTRHGGLEIVAHHGGGRPSRVRQHRLQGRQLHLRHRVPRALAPREPQPRHPRVDQAGVRASAPSPSSSRWLTASSRAPGAGGGLPRAARDSSRSEPATTARFVFLAGVNNQCFLAESQQRTYDFFDSCRKGYHSLHMIPNYGHLDIFIGKNAATDVFPLIIAELDRA